MAPDLNSLPPSRSSTSSPQQLRSAIDTGRSSSGAPMSGNVSTDLSHRSSLRGHRDRPSISEGRRRSGMNLNDPNAPADNGQSLSFGNFFRTASPSSLGGSPVVGTGDPHHQRAPSLGELHQELEQEQEAQVNRLLQMIRQQQAQLQQLQQQQQTQPPNSGTAVIDDITPNSERSHPFPSVPPTPGSRPVQQGLPIPPRRGSRASESASPVVAPTQPSPALDPAHSSVGSEWSVLGAGETPSSSARRGSRDESSFYQAEAAMLARENQMLQMRIRVLERQLQELSENGTSEGAASSAAVSEKT